MRSFTIALYFAVLSGSAVSQDVMIGVDYHYAKADSLYNAGNYSAAIDHLKKALVTTKSSAEINLLKAKCHLKRNETALAEKYLRRASRIGSYESDKLLDSLKVGTRRTEASEQFKKELQEYLDQTESPEK